MKRTTFMLSLACSVAAAAFAQDFRPPWARDTYPVALKGYVVDARCAKGMVGKDDCMKKAKAHSKQCALEEASVRSGYGLIADGKWYKFDEGGDIYAREAIGKDTRPHALMYEIKGMVEGSVLVVDSIVGQHPPEAPARKKQVKAPQKRKK